MARPNLSSYMEFHRGDTYTDTLGHYVESISHLRIYCPPPPLSSMKRLCVLQLGVDIGDLHGFLDDMMANKSTWPRLKHIEIQTAGMNDSAKAEAKLVIDTFNEVYFHDLPSRSD